MASSPDQAAVDYYRDIAAVLLPHLSGRPLQSAAPVMPAVPVTPPQTVAELMGLVRAGVLEFAGPPTGRIAIRLTPGAGSDIATAATAALQLAEQCAADGLAPVPLTDGVGGLWLMAATSGDPAAAANRYLALLTSAAPELATADPAGADGRTLVAAHCGPHSHAVPLPYTLLPAAGWPAAAVPLHLDEVAAITAGMPAEISADDVALRLAARGDLASALLDGAIA